MSCLGQGNKMAIRDELCSRITSVRWGKCMQARKLLRVHWRVRNVLLRLKIRWGLSQSSLGASPRVATCCVLERVEFAPFGTPCSVVRVELFACLIWYRVECLQENGQDTLNNVNRFPGAWNGLTHRVGISSNWKRTRHVHCTRWLESARNLSACRQDDGRLRQRKRTH